MESLNFGFHFIALVGELRAVIFQEGQGICDFLGVFWLDLVLERVIVIEAIHLFVVFDMQF